MNEGGEWLIWPAAALAALLVNLLIAGALDRLLARPVRLPAERTPEAPADFIRLPELPLARTRDTGDTTTLPLPDAPEPVSDLPPPQAPSTARPGPQRMAPQRVVPNVAIPLGVGSSGTFLETLVGAESFAPAPGPEGGPLADRGGDRLLEIVELPDLPESWARPLYPYAALIERIEGYVVIEALVMPDGSVSALSIVESEPTGVFDRAVMRAARRWSFDQFAADEPRRYRTRVMFRLADGEAQ